MQDPAQTAAMLLGLQRTAGNRAVAGLGRGALVVQRLDEDTQKIFDEIGGTELIAAINADVNAWVDYRKSMHTLTGAAMPGDAAGAKIRAAASKVRDGYYMNPKWGEVKAHLTALIANKPLFQELASYKNYGPVDDLFDGITHKVPGHKYTLQVVTKLDAIEEIGKEVTDPLGDIPKDVLDKIPDPVKEKMKDEALKRAGKAGEHVKKVEKALGWLKATKVNVAYTSSEFGGITWERPLTVYGLSWGVDLKGRNKGPLTIEISGRAKADPAPAKFFGGGDLDGPVVVAAASAGASGLGQKAKFTDASVVRMGPGGMLQFGSIEGDLEVKDDPNKIEPKLSVNLSGGIGWAFADGDDEGRTDSAGYRAIAVPVERTILQDSLMHFATGSAELTGLVREKLNAKMPGWLGKIAQLRSEVEVINAQLLLCTPPVQQDYRLTFFVDGWASRIWSDAADDVGRTKKNQELSFRRAGMVATELERALPEQHEFLVTAKGASTLAPNDTEGAEPIPDASADDPDMLEREREEWRRRDPNLTDAEIEEILKLRYGRKSNLPEVRGVRVLAIWRGYGVAYEPVLASEEGGGEQRRPSDDGEGGAEGAPAYPRRPEGQGGAPAD